MAGCVCVSARFSLDIQGILNKLVESTATRDDLYHHAIHP